MESKYRAIVKDYLTVANGDAGYTTSALVAAIIAAAVAGVEYCAWEYTVPPQQKIKLGHGAPDVGRGWFAAIDATTDFEVSLLKFIACDHERYNNVPIMQFNDQLMHSVTPTSLATAALINRQEMPVFPLTGPFIKEDSRLRIMLTQIVAATACDQCGFVIPITRYFLK